MRHTLVHTAAALAAALVTTDVAHADLATEWIKNLPIGTSLSAGLGGMAVAPSGVTFVTGTSGPSSSTDVLTAAIAPDGSMLWSHTWNGPMNGGDQGRAVALGPGGVVYVTGNTPDFQSFANVLLLEYDAATGALLNTKVYSSGPQTSEHGGSIVVDAQGGVYVCGGTTGDGADALIVKFDAAGVLQWTKSWDGQAFGPYSQDNALLVRLSPAGEPVVLIHGVMAGNQPDYVVRKLAPADGALIWHATWGVNGGDYPRDMKLDAAGDVYVTGVGIDLIDKYSTVKLAGTDGTLLWQAYDSAGVDNSVAAVALDEQGGVYITGAADPDGNHSNFNDNFYTVKRDAASGTQIWTHSYGTNCVGCYDVPGDVAVDASGHVFVAGITSSAPYSSDVITFVLDTASGVELQRGVVASSTPLTSRAGRLRFDAAFDLFHAGEIYNANTGATDMSVFKYASLAIAPGVAFCAGDGSGTACPCGASGAAGYGCPSSVSALGGKLTATGAASVGADSLALLSTLVPNGPAIYMQCSGTVSLPFGDGLVCMSVGIVRLGVVFASGGSSVYPGGSTPAPMHLAGSTQMGDLRHYQAWYRDAAIGFCAPEVFNFTNGISVTWTQ
jgi:hypothetical protein